MKLLCLALLSALVVKSASAVKCPANVPGVATYLTVYQDGEESSNLWTVSPTKKMETQATGCGAEAFITQSLSEGTCESVASMSAAATIYENGKCYYYFEDEYTSKMSTLVLSCDYSAGSLELDSTVEVTQNSYGGFIYTFTGKYEGVCNADGNGCPTEIEHATKVITEKSSLAAYNSPYTWVISPTSQVMDAPNGYQNCAYSGFISQYKRCQATATEQYEEPTPDSDSCAYKYSDSSRSKIMTLTLMCDSSAASLNLDNYVYVTSTEGKQNYALAGWYKGVCDTEPATTTYAPFNPTPVDPNDNGDDSGFGIFPLWVWCTIGGGVVGAIIFTGVFTYFCTKRRQRMNAIASGLLLEGGACPGIVVCRNAESAQRLLDRHPAENEESLLINGYQSTDDRPPAEEAESPTEAPSDLQQEEH